MTLKGFDGPPLNSRSAVSSTTCSKTVAPARMRDGTRAPARRIAISALTSALAATSGATRRSGKTDGDRKNDAATTATSIATVVHHRRDSHSEMSVGEAAKYHEGRLAPSFRSLPSGRV